MSKKAMADRHKKQRAKEIEAFWTRLRRYGVLNWSREQVGKRLDDSTISKTRLLDEILMEEKGNSLVENLTTVVNKLNVQFRLVTRERGVAILIEGSLFGVVHPTHASYRNAMGQPTRLDGDFTDRGSVWVEFASRMMRVLDPKGTEEETETGEALEVNSPPAELEIVTDPNLLSEIGMLEAAEDASERIRHKRSLALPYVAKLNSADFEMTFNPITSEGRAPRVGFVFERNDQRVDGVIYLKSPETPIAIGFASGDEDCIALAWGNALRGFADLTCPEPAEVTSTPDHRSGRATPSQRSRSSHRASQRRSFDGSTNYFLGSTIIADGRTRSLMSSFVVGHKRRLAQNRSASAEVKVRAQDLGITLGPNETWVRPHTRGMPADTILTFAWTPDS